MTIRPADVLLVEGARSKINSAIRYLTQSTWSHSAMYVGLGAGLGERDGEPLVLVEAELGQGVIASPLSKYDTFNTRICRPVGLTPEDRIKRDPLRLRAHRLFLRPQEHHRPDALLPAEPAGAGELAAAHDRARLGRADARDLLELDRAGVRVGRLSDPAGGAPGRSREPQGDPAHPASFAVHAARFRRFAVFRGGEADDRDRIRLQESCNGIAARRPSATTRDDDLRRPQLRRQRLANKRNNTFGRTR